MINLNATTKSLEVLLSGSITTNQLTIVSSYVDVDQTAITVSTIGENDTVTNNTTAVTAVAAPASGTTRQIKSVTVQNTDTVSALVTVRVNNNSIFRPVITQTLAANQSLVYEEGAGWILLPTTAATPAVIQSIQRGTITMTSTTSGTATITAVITANSSLRWLGEDIQTDSNVIGTQCRALLTLTDSTTVTATRSNGTGTVRVNFEVVEYATGVVKSVQRGTIGLASAASNTATITSVSTTKAQCNFLGNTTSEANSGEFTGRTSCKVTLTNATTVTASRGIGTNDCTVGYEVLEFN